MSIQRERIRVGGTGTTREHDVIALPEFTQPEEGNDRHVTFNEIGADLFPTPLPLNSQRLNTDMLKQLATGLGLPVRAAKAEILQLIEGRLIGMGKEPRAVQVVVTPEESGLCLSLQDVEGVIIRVGPPPEPDLELKSKSSSFDNNDDPVEEVEPTTELARVQRELEQSRRQQEKLQTQINGALEREAALQAEVAKLKARLSEVWQTNCEHMTQFDAALTKKEDEIKHLKRNMRSAMCPMPEADHSSTSSIETPPMKQRMRSPHS